MIWRNWLRYGRRRNFPFRIWKSALPNSRSPPTPRAGWLGPSECKSRTPRAMSIPKHSADFALSDTLRPLLWERMEIVAANNGLFRLWTEESAPFWRKHAGFSPAPGETLKRLPEVFGAAHEKWLALRLRDESADPGLARGANPPLQRGRARQARETLATGGRAQDVRHRNRRAALSLCDGRPALGLQASRMTPDACRPGNRFRSRNSGPLPAPARTRNGRGAN